VHPLDHLIALILCLAGPVLSRTVGFRRLRRASTQELPAVRRSVYRVAIIVQWALAGLVLLWWRLEHRSLVSIGLAPVITAGMIGTLVGLVIVAVALIRQRMQALRDDDALAEVRRRLDHIELMLPHSAAEFGGFARLSVTAGVCEELLYRGFLTWYFAHVMGLLPAMAVASIVFGLGHAYQGPRGMALTTVVGAFFAGVYWVSGSLYVSMLIHALMDLHSGHLAWKAYERRPPEPEPWRQEPDELPDFEPPDSGAPRPDDGTPPAAAHDDTPLSGSPERG
jgi:membrane protease YdiL (CAAX protease family)